ncbi:MAG: ParA family protein [Eubacteriales bacterium]|nr:ParA family protein [Eubacteriales bacterium]
MSLVIAVANQKGGVGKTTSCISIAAAIARRKRSVLLVDVDPQSNTTSGVGVKRNSVELSTYDLLLDDSIDACDAVRNVRPNFDLIPATIDLAGAEIELVPMQQREHRLRKSLAAVHDKYDYIIMDCPPSLGLLTLNGLIAAEAVLVPVQAEYYALEGLMQLFSTMDIVRKTHNPKLRLAGVFITMFDVRTQLSQQVKDEVSWYFGENFLQTVVPRNVRLSEAPSHSQTIFEYDKRSKGAKAYAKLTDELLQKLESDAWKQDKIGHFD